jgi:RND family efflux transporter MFP subunit
MKRYIALLLLVAAAAACSTGRSEEPENAAANAPPAVMLGAADVATVGRADLIAGVPVSGTLEPVVKVEIISPYPEVVDEVLVREGQIVERGQLIARFRADALEAAALSAEAQQRMAASDHERMQNLFKEGAVSARDVENAEAALRAAQSVTAAAKKRLDEAMVRSPVAGTVSRRDVDSGDRLGDGVFMFEIVNTTQLEFEASVPSEHIGTFGIGAPVALSGSGLPAEGVSGRVARINATADPATRQVKIYVAVPNQGGRIVAGLFASGRVVQRQVKNALAVAREAIRAGDDGKTYVLLVVDGRIDRRDVTVGAVDDVQGLAEVAGGLVGGETVVVGPAEGLRPEQPVTITGREG